MVNRCPNNDEIFTEYLELLLDDYLLPEDKDTITQIAVLLEKFNKITLKIRSMHFYMYQRLLVAKCQFFIKENFDIAFEYLNEAMTKVEDNN